MDACCVRPSPFLPPNPEFCFRIQYHPTRVREPCSIVSSSRSLVRHTVRSWIRDPTWGGGSVVAQIVLVGLALLLLFPVGALSYFIGEGLRDVYPNTDVLRLVNRGVLYVPLVFLVSRFFLQARPGVRLQPYLPLPLNRRALVHTQALLPVASLHSLFAAVALVPLWTHELVGTLPPVSALAWLVAALVWAVLVPSYGAQLLQTTLGRRPARFAGLAAITAVVLAVDAWLGLNLLPTVSGGLFGRPLLGLAATGTLAAALHEGTVQSVLHTLRADDTGRQRRGTVLPSAVRSWVERTLPGGRHAVLELQLIARHRRTRGFALFGIGFGLLFAALLGGEAWAGGAIENGVNLFNAAFWGVAGFMVQYGPLCIGISSSFVDGVLTRPAKPRQFLLAKLTVMWAGAAPTLLVFLPILALLPIHQSALFIGLAVYMLSILCPLYVYFGPKMRKPVDLSKSSFSISKGSFHAIGILPALIPVLIAPFVLIFADGQLVWYATAGAFIGVSLLSLLLLRIKGLEWMEARLRENRHDLTDGFRTNDPI